MNRKTLKPFKKKRKKTGGRKKGIPNKVNREVKDLFQRTIGFIKDEDLFAFYKKLKKRPDLFLKFLSLISPKDFNVFFKTPLTQNVLPDLSKLSEKEKENFLKITEKIENDKNITSS